MNREVKIFSGLINVFRWVLLLISFLFSIRSYSQTPYFKRIYLESENSDLKFTAELKDHRGMLWFGSTEGLIAYDGNTHFTYRINAPGFSNAVSSLFEDGGDTLWVGYHSGAVAYLAGRELKLFHPEEGVPKKSITAIQKDSLKNLWLATAGEGVYFFKGNRLYNIDTDDSLNDNYAYTLMPDQQGNMWVGTDEGMALCSASPKKKVISSFHIGEGLPDNIVRVIVPAGNGDLWIGLQQKGVCLFIVKESRFEIPNCLKEWKYGQVNAILRGSKGLWIGTEEQGIVFVSDDCHRPPENYSAMAGNNFSKVTAVITDNEENGWMLANSNIFQSTGNRVMLLNQVPGVDMKMIHTLMYDSKGRLWFTPDQGLVCYTRDNHGLPEIKRYSVTPARDLIDIVSLHEDECGYIWIGTMGGGLFRLNSATGRLQKIAGIPSLDHASIMSITGKGNIIYAATFSGAVKITFTDCNDDRIHISAEGLEKVPQLGNYYMYDVFTDSKGRTWFATDGKGITCYDSGKYTNYNKTSGLGSDVIYSVTEDETGNIWFSTENAGLYKFDGKRFTNINQADGLRSLSISGIIADGNGNIIVIHNHGFDRINIRTGNIRYYGPEIEKPDMNSDLNAVCRDLQGHVWIGTDEGIIRFYGGDSASSPRPAMLITKVSVFNKEIKADVAPGLLYNQNYITFDFLGLWYSNPDRIKYQYMLEGYNKEWVNTLDRKVVFPKLEPGSYTFRVRCSLNQHFKENTESSFGFNIALPVWRQSWFIFLMSLVTAALGYMIIVYRVRHVKRIEALKKEKVEFQFETLKSQVNPHFLFNSFNTLINIIEDDSKKAIEYVETLSAFFRNIVSFKDQDVITLAEELDVASVYFYLQQKRFGNSLRLKVNVDEKLRKKKIPPMVLQILMENAVKHNAISSETPLDIVISAEGNKLLVRNNINRKRNTESSTRTGLQNIVNRFKLLTSEPVVIRNSANEFSVTIPLI
jgi:ligand-binding sensor domain-containing protein